MQSTIYLNAADGRKSPKLAHIKIRGNPQKKLETLLKYFAQLYGCNSTLLEIDQNITTHIGRIITAMLRKKPEYNVFVSNHEIRFIKKSLEAGKLLMSEVTHPNYAKLRPVQFQKIKTIVFDPNQFTKNPKNIIGKKKSIVILSHVSRLTGETFPIRMIYQRMKKLNPQNSLIVDGAQFTGTEPFKIENSCDGYVTCVSKFVGAEPELGIAYISKGVRNQFIKNYPKINPKKYSKELYSATCQIKKMKRMKNPNSHVKKLRQKLLEGLKEIKGIKIAIPASQINHMVTISAGGRKRTQSVVARLRGKEIIVSGNFNYSVAEPKTPLIRIGLTFETTTKYIEQFLDKLKTL